MAVVVHTKTEPPDVRGPTAPLPLLILAVGASSLAVVIAGTLVIQAVLALSGGPVSAGCRALGLIPYVSNTPTSPARGIQGARGVCHIVEGLTSTAEYVVLGIGIALGIAAVAAGFATYRRMDTRRRREHAITGAVLGIQAAVLGAGLWLYSSGTPDKFVLQFMNFVRLKGPDGMALVRGVKYTLLLAFGGEAGGVAIGLILALFALSQRRAVRAPARTYINFFRGTPLLWQLSAFYFGINLGLGLHLASYTVALIVFALNTGAYAAEVFRAGIQSIERGQYEAARSLGMSYLQAMRYAIVPQAVRRVIPPLMNEFVILIKDTALVAFIGLNLGQLDLFSAAQQGYSDTFSATFFVAAAIGYLVVTLPLIRLVNWVEGRLRSGLVGIAGATA